VKAKLRLDIWLRRLGLPLFVISVFAVLVASMFRLLPTDYAQQVSALLTPVIAIFGGLIAIATFQMNYDKWIFERRKPILELQSEFMHWSRYLMLNGAPPKEEIRLFCDRVSKEIDAELGMHLEEFFLTNSMAGSALNEWADEFSRKSRVALERV